MVCPECGGDVEMMVDVTMLIPSELEGNLTKRNLRKKGVVLYAANWGKASYFCKNCRWNYRNERDRIMLDWKRTDEELPEVLADVLAYNVDTYQLKFGFRSEMDIDSMHWINFSFPVTHWAYCNLPE